MLIPYILVIIDIVNSYLLPAPTQPSPVQLKTQNIQLNGHGQQPLQQNLKIPGWDDIACNLTKQLLKGQGLASGDVCSNSSIVCHLSSTPSPCALSGRPPLKDCVALAWIASTPRSWQKQCEHWTLQYSLGCRFESEIIQSTPWPHAMKRKCSFMGFMVHWSMAHHCFIMLPLLNLASWIFFLATATTVPYANKGCCVKVQVQVQVCRNCIVSESVRVRKSKV